MTQKKYTESVSIVHPVCCGLDVHKRKICKIPVTSMISKNSVQNSGDRKFR